MANPIPKSMLEAMGAQLILGAQQILMVLGAQGAQEDQTEGGSPGSPDGESPGIQKDVDSTTGNYGLRQCAPKNSFLPKTFPF